MKKKILIALLLMTMGYSKGDSRTASATTISFEWNNTMGWLCADTECASCRWDDAQGSPKSGASSFDLLFREDGVTWKAERGSAHCSWEEKSKVK